MNNQQFRKLMLSKSNGNGGSEMKSHTSAQSQSLLGARQRNSVTSKSAQGSSSNTFAPRQTGSGKQFRSFAPRGVKLGTGYRDRTQDRVNESEDDKAKRVKALEESVKNEEITQEDFERMRDEITGGEVQNTHLVKGLDWKLLRRIKQGEDVDKIASTETENVDDEFDEIEQKEVKVSKKPDGDKKGSLAPLAKASAKTSRDEILAELKASRKRAAEDVAPQLGSKFRKIGDSGPLLQAKAENKGKPSKLEPEKVAEAPKLIPLDHGVIIPEQKPKAEPESDDDIYADVGDTYDPLGDLGKYDSDDEQEEAKPLPNVSNSEQSIQPLTRTKLFDDQSTSVLGKMSDAKSDTAFLAAIARAGKDENDKPTEAPVTEEEARLRKRLEMLSQKDRDLDDMDMGFGSSRFDDAEEMAMESSKVKLSEWKGGRNDDDDDDDDGGPGGKDKKKRKPKKRKGDKNSMVDVMAVMNKKN